MKKALLFSLIIITTLILISCSKTYYTEIETTEISDITFSEETTKDDEIINSSFKYIPFSNSSEIGEIINNNPIDKLYFEEMKEVVTTKDMVDIYQKYLDVWQNELDIAVEIIEKNIPKENLEKFQISQEAWESFYETNPNIAVDMYSVNMGMGSIFHIIYGEKALHMERYRTLELAEYCYLLTGSFEFKFVG